MEDFDIRFTTMEDYEPLHRWFSEPGATDDFAFDEKEMESALKNWIGFCKYKASLTGMIRDVPCAVGTLFLMPYLKVAHHCSFYLMVDPQHRNKGIGTSMVRNLLHLAKTRFRLESVHVEVFEPSPLLPLLEKQKFEMFARQEDYVKMNGERKARILLEHFF
ncbi:MAG: GNAT family N-acetyltransferase [Verrucomicrobia bacterium]|nr:GNAT family N-acetyltransferase [Verrucomicrobiota bacterium]